MTRESGDGESIHRPDEFKALELVYALALSYSTSFNTVGAAVVFGLFSLLLLLDSAGLFSPLWVLLSIAYCLTVLTGLYFYLRAIRYSMMATEVARRLGILSLSESIYDQSASSSFLHRLMIGKFAPYGKFTSLYVVIGPLVLFLLWIFVAFR
ncbi:MAG TPA: hypothetical protein VE955_00840 [Candidatus Dormibacteraeota bacterium]|jgi:hypothetical protein|nr:hypothetical protein [Candidatus Dormibacteraeota bacterium]